MAEVWTGFARWVAANQAGLIAGGLVVALLVLLPLWLAWLDRLRWGALRRRLVEAAFAAHAASAANAACLSRQLFRASGAMPLERLSRCRDAIEQQRADSEQFCHTGALLAAAVAPRLADALASTTALCSRTGTTLTRLARLYLKEATVRVGSSAVDADDQLGFAAGQIVSLHYLSELGALADGLAEDAARDRQLLLAAMPRRMRRAMRSQLDQAAEQAVALSDDVRRFCAGLQPMDPTSIQYKNRPNGERGARSIEALIARFDRRG